MRNPAVRDSLALAAMIVAAFVVLKFAFDIWQRISVGFASFPG